MKKEKNVTNLLSNISKARDLLDEGDIKKIYNNQYFFEKLKNDIARQCKKYIETESYEADFNHEDLRALSDGLFDLADRNIKMRYSNLYKTLTKNKPVTMEDFNQLCYRVADTMYFDRFFRQLTNEISHWAVTFWLWSESDYKKDFMSQIEEHIRSFL